MPRIPMRWIHLQNRRLAVRIGCCAWIILTTIFIYVSLRTKIPENCESQSAETEASIRNDIFKTGTSNLNYETGPVSLETRFCQSRTRAFWKEGFVNENNEDWNWNLSETWKCPNYYYTDYPFYRRKANLDCTSGNPQLVYTTTDSPSDVHTVEPDDTCLQSFIKNCCYDDGKPVPNVLHYIWFADVDVELFTMVSFISAIRFMRPCLILFHGSYIPKGMFWNFFISVYSNVVLVKEPLIKEVFGHKLKYKEHGSDLMRIKAIQTYGGVYLDWDEVLVQPIEPLRVHKFTMSLEMEGKIGSQFLMGEQNPTFLTHWYNGYKNYSDDWTYNAIIVPFQISQKFPEMINLEKYTCTRPVPPKVIKSAYQDKDFIELLTPLWEMNADWSNNYAIHFYAFQDRSLRTQGIRQIRNQNHTLGAVCRYILFGKKEVCQ